MALEPSKVIIFDSEHTLIELAKEDLPLPLEPVTDFKSYERSGKLPESISMPTGGKAISVKNVLLLCNKHSGSGNGTKVGEETKTLFERVGVMATLTLLDHSGHAEEICKTEDLSQYDVVCCIGGDGTFHEAANGILKSKNSKDKPLALIPAGTGNSFCLELKIESVNDAVDHILRGLVCPIDAVQIHFENQPEKEDIFSVNSIHWGLASSVNVTAEKLRWMGHALRYTTAALYEFVKGEKTAAKIELETADGEKHCYDDEFCLVIANNIQGAAKGMKLAPEARINDGLLDLLLIRTNNQFNLVSAFSQAYSGTHTDLEYVQYEKVKKFSITSYKSKDSSKEIEEVTDIDGELTGVTPFTATVLQRVLNLVI